MVHPRFIKADDATPLPTQLTPVYPTTAGLGQATLRKLVSRALEAPIADTLPADWLAELRLPELDASIRLLHQPPPDSALAELESRRHPAWQRLAFDELLAQQLSLAAARRQRRSQRTTPLPAKRQLTAAFIRALPFDLTAAQDACLAGNQRRPDAAASDAPPAAGRCRQRQDRGRRARVPAGHRERLAGRLHGADRNSCRAAFPQTGTALVRARRALRLGIRQPAQIRTHRRLAGDRRRARSILHSAPTRCFRKVAASRDWAWR